MYLSDLCFFCGLYTYIIKLILSIYLYVGIRVEGSVGVVELICTNLVFGFGLRIEI